LGLVGYGIHVLTIRDEFVPPKPNEFDKNTFIFFSESFYDISLEESSSDLKLYCNKIVLHHKHRINNFTGTAIQHSWPVMGLVELTGIFSHRIPRRFGFTGISVCVDVAWALT
jgi:hypothetical protein